MFGKTIKIAGTIVSMLVLFLILIWALYIILGNPDCDTLANNTAYNLKFAIDEVSTDKVPFTDIGTEPDSLHYRQAPIKLCQEDYIASKLAMQGKTENPIDQIYSWVLKLSGGEPQYKIYYEIFPEGGGGMWQESYPWNGGAASTFVFWALLRGVSFGIEKLSPAFLGYKSIWSVFKWVKGMGDVADSVTEAGSIFEGIYGKPFMLGQLMTQSLGSSFILTSDIDNFNISNKSIILFDSERRKASDATEILNKKHSEAIIDGLKNSNFIRKNSGSMIRVDSKIAVNNEELPLIFNKKVINGEEWTMEEYAVAVDASSNGGSFDPEKVDWANVQEIPVTKDSDGNYDMAAINSRVNSGYVLLTYKPNELVRDMYNQLKKSNDKSEKEKANELESYWYWDEDASSGSAFTTDEVLKTKYGYEIYRRGVDNFENRISSLEDQGLLTKNTVLHSGDISPMLQGFREAAFAGDSDAQNIREAFLAILGDLDNGIYEKICYVLNIPDPCTLSYNNMFDALQSDLESTKKTGIYHPEVGAAGIMMLWDNLGINVDVKIMDILMRYPSGVANAILLAEVGPVNKAGFSDTEITNIYNEQYNWLHDPSGGDYDTKHDVSVLPKGMGKIYLKRWVNALKQIPSSGPIPDQYKWAVDDIGFVIGLYKQESSTAQILPPKKFRREIAISGFDNKTEISFQGGLAWELIKRPLFWNVKQLITPSSGIAKGFLLSSTEGCLGNSLCVYSHGALMNPEKPFYLNASVKDYFIRVWRPVSPLMAVAGIEGFLKQVPSHPRFYVASPCFGMAKIWKTKYNGEKTIFIKIDKFDLNDTASNYCYADEGLIHTYGEIWFLSTVGQVVESVASWGLKKAAQEAGRMTLSQTFAKTVLNWDPVLLAQSFAEAYISWPGWPFKSLTFESMTSETAGKSTIGFGSKLAQQTK